MKINVIFFKYDKVFGRGSFHLTFGSCILYTVCLFNLRIYFVFSLKNCYIEFYMIYIINISTASLPMPVQVFD